MRWWGGVQTVLKYSYLTWLQAALGTSSNEYWQQPGQVLGLVLLLT